jgi:hypothetical protein
MYRQTRDPAERERAYGRGSTEAGLLEVRVRVGGISRGSKKRSKEEKKTPDSDMSIDVYVQYTIYLSSEEAAWSWFTCIFRKAWLSTLMRSNPC